MVRVLTAFVILTIAGMGWCAGQSIPNHPPSVCTDLGGNPISCRSMEPKLSEQSLHTLRRKLREARKAARRWRVADERAGLKRALDRVLRIEKELKRRDLCRVCAKESCTCTRTK